MKVRVERKPEIEASNISLQIWHFSHHALIGNGTFSSENGAIAHEKIVPCANTRNVMQKVKVCAIDSFMTLENYTIKIFL